MISVAASVGDYALLALASSCSICLRLGHEAEFKHGVPPSIRARQIIVNVPRSVDIVLVSNACCGCLGQNKCLPSYTSFSNQ